MLVGIAQDTRDPAEFLLLFLNCPPGTESFSILNLSKCSFCSIRGRFNKCSCTILGGGCLGRGALMQKMVGKKRKTKEGRNRTTQT